MLDWLLRERCEMKCLRGSSEIYFKHLKHGNILSSQNLESK